MTRGQILVTDGLGYIGSHTCVALAEPGHGRLVILDNLSNSKSSVLERIRELAPGATIEFHRASATVHREPVRDRRIRFRGLRTLPIRVREP